MLLELPGALSHLCAPRPAMTSLFVSAAERESLKRDPEAFVCRAESVVGSLLSKLRTLEAERQAEQIDTEQLYHSFARDEATLRSERDQLLAQSAGLKTEHASAVSKLEATAAEAAALRSQLASNEAERKRFADAESEMADERRRFCHRTHFSHMSHPTFPISHLVFFFLQLEASARVLGEEDGSV